MTLNGEKDFDLSEDEVKSGVEIEKRIVAELVKLHGIWIAEGRVGDLK